MSATTETTPPDGGLKICLAASGGGHLRQLLDLQAVWSEHDHFFVTEDTALGHTLAKDHRTYFVPHFAWGQAKLGAPFRMLGLAFQSVFRSAGLILREKPQLVISSGAGAMIFTVLWARLAGARVVIMESFARFERPSLFGRLSRPLAHDFVIQSAKLAPRYPKARLFDPFRMLDGTPPPKKPLMFATVGATLPFDRLVDTVAEVVRSGGFDGEVIIQTGVGGHSPEGFELHETLPFDRVQEILRDAAVVVCHGGTGSLITALRQGCQVIAMPRLSKLGEHYDDHQAEITEAFAARGLIQVANTPDELRDALQAARSRAPVMATTDPRELIAFLKSLIAGLGDRKAA